MRSEAPGGWVLALAFAAALAFFVSFAQLVAVRLAAGLHGLTPLQAEGVGALFGLGGILGCLLAGLVFPDPGETEDLKACSAGLGLAGLTALAAAEAVPTAFFVASMVPGGLGLGAAVPRLMRTLRGTYGPTGLCAPFALATAATYVLANGLELWRGDPAGAARILGAMLLGTSAALAGLEGPGGRPAVVEGARNDGVASGHWHELALVAAADSFGFGLVMHSSLAAVTFQLPAQLAFNGVMHAAGAMLALGLAGRTSGRRILAAGLAAMSAGYLALALGSGSAEAGFAWSALVGLGVGAYHVPYFAALAGGPASDRLAGIALATLLAGWLPAGAGLATGRLLLLLVPDPLPWVITASMLLLVVATLLVSGDEP